MNNTSLMAFIGGCVLTSILIIKIIGLKLLTTMMLIITSLFIVGKVAMMLSTKKEV